jgi:hypothetical protein
MLATPRGGVAPTVGLFWCSNIKVEKSPIFRDFSLFF